MMKRLFGIALAAIVGVAAANAEIFNFRVNMSGAQESPPGSGDPDGYGVAHLSIDDSTNPPTIAWQIEVFNISDTITGDHIHQGAAGTNGPVKIDFDKKLSGSGLQDADLTGVLGDPTGWYVNVHTDAFPKGAIRGQIPEPSTIMLLALAGLAALRRR